MATGQQIDNGLIRVVEGQIVVGTQFQIALAELKATAAMLRPITDQLSYEEAVRVVGNGHKDVKVIMALAEPEIIAARNRLQTLRDQRDQVMAQFLSVTDPIEANARQWNINERQAAKAEEKDLNYGKPAEKRVSIAPNIPSVSGAVRVIPHYRCEVVNVDKVKRAWMTPDIKRIEAKARADKDVQLTEKEVGGVKIRME